MILLKRVSPVGMIQGDEEKIRFAWGVKALPWLILTDKNHVVVAEGFEVGDLDGHVEQAGRNESADDI